MKTIALALLLTTVLHAAEALPSWNDTAARKAITGFVTTEDPKRGWTIVSMKNDWNTIHPATK